MLSGAGALRFQSSCNEKLNNLAKGIPVYEPPASTNRLIALLVLFGTLKLELALPAELASGAWLQATKSGRGLFYPDFPEPFTFHKAR